MPISKETILQEIRRLASANGGVAPGKDRFESETGILTSAWLIKHWGSWGEALQEAGFEPNKLISALPVETLLEALARLTKEKKQIPTYVQLRMHARATAGFPSHTTFARLGSKPEIIVKLLAHCRGRQDFADVIAICERTLASLPKDAAQNTDSSDRDGFVYLIKSGKHYKIGRTNDPDRRERELGNQTVEKNVRVHSIRTDDPSGIEAYWHRRFADKRIRSDGEWFALNAKEVAAFKRRKKFM